ncbi:MAG: CehA/McbA family metallohydrolase [Deltaproteobacteria bacterium]|nr:CehA/McbA family metallohydrolase [Deltaproteobacteria bacterium]
MTINTRMPACVVCVLLLPAAVAAQECKVYFGNIHAHTSVSDGDKAPLDAYTYARDTAKLDFFSLTDHMEQTLPSEWESIKDAAEQTQVPGLYVTLWGYEWGSPTFNHINIFMQDHFYSIVPYLFPPLQKFYDEVLQYPPAIMQFNHPEYQPAVPTYNWNHFAYVKEIDDLVSLIEVKDRFDVDTKQELAYIDALDKGWHISAVYNQDNHGPDWGTKNDCRAAVWLKEFTRDGLIEGLRAGRTYSSCDKNAVLRFMCGGQWAGETRLDTTPLPCTLFLDDPDPADTFTKVEVVSVAGAVVQTIDNPQKGVEIALSLDANKTDRYFFYLRITVNGSIPIWSAPVWYGETAAQTDGGTPDDVAGDAGAGDDGAGTDANMPDVGSADAEPDVGAPADAGNPEDAAQAEDSGGGGEAGTGGDAGGLQDAGGIPDVAVETDTGDAPDRSRPADTGAPRGDGAPAPADVETDGDAAAGCSCSVLSP